MDNFSGLSLNKRANKVSDVNDVLQSLKDLADQRLRESKKVKVVKNQEIQTEEESSYKHTDNSALTGVSLVDINTIIDMKLSNINVSEPTVKKEQGFDRNFIAPGGTTATYKFTSGDTSIQAGDVVTFNNNTYESYLERVQVVKYTGSTTQEGLDGIFHGNYGKLFVIGV